MQLVRTLFFHRVLRKFMENTNDKPIFASTIFFTNINISYLNLCSDLFSIITKKVNQIGNNVACIVAPLVSVFCCALTMGCWNALQDIFINQKKSDFYSHISKLYCFLWLLLHGCRQLYSLHKNRRHFRTHCKKC